MPGNAQTEAVFKKRKKAQRYANEPERFELSCIRATMTSEHGTRKVEFSEGKWQCTCEFYAENGTCSHTMALEILLRDYANLKIAPAVDHE
jgi:hypothetical protein